MYFLEWLTASYETLTVREIRQSGWRQVGPGLGPYMSAAEPAFEARERRESVPVVGWPMRRRLRFAANAGLLATLAAALFWWAWWLVAGSVPETVSVPLTAPPCMRAIALPVALSRLWDIPASFGWAFGLALLGSYLAQLGQLSDQPFKQAAWLGLVGGLVNGLIFGLVFWLVGGLDFFMTFGLGMVLVIGLRFGLHCGLAAGLVCGLAAGLGYWLAFGLGTGLSIGLTTGLAPLLPVLLLAVPALMALSELALRHIAAQDVPPPAATV